MKPLAAWQLVRHFGPRWLVGRSLYVLKRKSGWWEKRLPTRTWNDLPLADLLAEPRLAAPDLLLAERRRGDRPKFFFTSDDRADFATRLRRYDRAGVSPLAEADALAIGWTRFFAHESVATGFPPAWHRHPETGHFAPDDTHWSRIDDFALGDIKLIWEPARFSFVFALVRAYWRTADVRYVELFWQAVESFRAANRPQQGVHWKCGQEASLRLMAWTFGLYGFLDAPATTAERVANLVHMVGVSAARIEANIDYAISQANNHGVSEGMGLWTAGLLYPELREATRWRELGRTVLHDEARRLIADDGSFSQHSTNYHRVMLHDYVWSMRLAELNGMPFEADVRDRLSLAADFLAAQVDPQSGGAPNYGHNDGALVLPLSNGDFADYRPAVQSARFACRHVRTFPPGSWDEELVWLFGADAEQAALTPPAAADLAAASGGYYAMRSRTSMLFTRAATFRHRPSHADLLHVDVWWQGQNIAIDPGTYRYNAAPPWNNVLGDTQFHNTVTVDDANQMQRAGRFLWMPWAAGRVRANQAAASGRLRYWDGEHDGYERDPFRTRHRRAIWRIGDDTFFIYDWLSSAKPHAYRLHWLFADFPYEQASAGKLRFTTPRGDYHAHIGRDTLSGSAGNGDGSSEYSVVRADPNGPRGWCSRYYNSRQPAVSVSLTCRARQAAFWTVLGPTACRVACDGGAITLATAPLEREAVSAGSPWTVRLTLANDGDDGGPLFTAGDYVENLHDRLVIAP